MRLHERSANFLNLSMSSRCEEASLWLVCQLLIDARSSRLAVSATIIKLRLIVHVAALTKTKMQGVMSSSTFSVRAKHWFCLMI